MDRADAAAAQWARERPDLRTLPMTLFGRLNEAAERTMRDHIHPFFAQAGLQGGEVHVLATLRRSGAPYQLSPTRLDEATMISSGGMTDRLDRLERAGLVVRRPDPGPSRQADRAHRQRQAPDRRGDRPPCRERGAAFAVAERGRAGNAERAPQEADRRSLGRACSHGSKIPQAGLRRDPPIPYRPSRIWRNGGPAARSQRPVAIRIDGFRSSKLEILFLLLKTEVHAIDHPTAEPNARTWVASGEGDRKLGLGA